MRKTPFAGLCLYFACAVCLADRPPPPPEPYVVKGACPFECCRYGTWSVKADTRLYLHPDPKSGPVGTVGAGQSVEGLTGEVHSVPVKFIVKRSHEAYKAGDIIWVYSYKGEGSFLVLRNGELVSEDLDFSPYGGGGGTRCQDEETYCWGTLERELPGVWWVKIKTKFGLEGWSDEPEHFGNKDACG